MTLFFTVFASLAGLVHPESSIRRFQRVFHAWLCLGPLAPVGVLHTMLCFPCNLTDCYGEREFEQAAGIGPRYILDGIRG